MSEYWRNLDIIEDAKDSENVHCRRQLVDPAVNSHHTSLQTTDGRDNVQIQQANDNTHLSWSCYKTAPCKTIWSEFVAEQNTRKMGVDDFLR